MVDLRGRDFLKLLDFTPTEINHLLKVAATLKKQKHNGESHRYLKGKQVVLLFEKDSTRTRCSFEAGAVDLGMQATYIDQQVHKWVRKKLLKILLEFFVECMMVLNIEVLIKQLLKL